jgi:hypothetical protein
MFGRMPAWRCPATAILLLAAALALAPARAQGIGGATNSPAAGGAEKTLPGQGKMDQFEDDLFGHNRTLDLQPPGVARIKRPVIPIPDERARQKQDAEKDWVFSTMNEMNSKPSMEEMLGMPEIGPDGREKKKLPAMEQYYNDLGKKNSPQNSSNSLGDALTMLWTVKQLSSTNGVNPLVFAFPAGDQSMLKTLLTMPDLNHADGGNASDGNDAADKSDSMAAAQAAAAADRSQKHFADGFKQLIGLEPSAPTTAPGTFGDATGTSFSSGPSGVFDPTPTPAAAPPATALAPSSLNPIAGAFAPAAAGGYHPFEAANGMPNANPAGISLQNTLPPPQPVSPVSAMPIDPFTAYFPKHTH